MVAYMIALWIVRFFAGASGAAAAAAPTAADATRPLPYLRKSRRFSASFTGVLLVGAKRGNRGRASFYRKPPRKAHNFPSLIRAKELRTIALALGGDAAAVPSEPRTERVFERSKRWGAVPL